MVLLLEVVIGAMTGWAMGELMHDTQFGIAGHITMGIIGGLIGSYCFNMGNISLYNALITSLIGAIGLVLAGRMARFDIP